MVIYAIQSEHLIKVGITAYLPGRLRLMDLLNPMPFTCIRFSYVPRDKARLIEKLTHDRLREFHVRREWFSADREAVIAALDEVIASVRNGEKRWAEKDGHIRLKAISLRGIGA